MKIFIICLVYIVLFNSCSNSPEVDEIFQNYKKRNEVFQHIADDRFLAREMIKSLVKKEYNKSLMVENKDLLYFMAKREQKTDCPSGRYTKRYPDGNLKEIGVFRRCNYYDTLIRYYENGEIEYQTIFNDKGNEQGWVKYFYPNGQEKYAYQAENGLPIGEATRYNEDGSINETIYYSSSGKISKKITKPL